MRKIFQVFSCLAILTAPIVLTAPAFANEEGGGEGSRAAMEQFKVEHEQLKDDREKLRGEMDSIHEQMEALHKKAEALRPQMEAVMKKEQALRGRMEKGHGKMEHKNEGPRETGQKWEMEQKHKEHEPK